MKRLVNLSISALLTVGGFALNAQTVQKFSATKANDYGMAYTLPVTVLDITIETETTVSNPGEFYKYAKRYFNISDPITKNSTEVKVLSITVNTHGEANPDDRYLMTFKPGYTPFMMIDDSGLPLSINTEERFTPARIAIPEARQAEPTPLETAAARQAMSEEIMQSQSTAKRAELAAAQIFALRQSRNDLITGQADQMPPDGKAMELILNNINAQEAALMAMFVGTRKVSTQVSTVSYTPDGATDVEARRVIARVSPVDGIVSADDLSGVPVYLSVSVTDRPEMPVNAKGQVVEIPRDAFIYRIPGKADVKVSFGGDVMADVSLEFAQYGIIYGLKPNMFTDKKAPAYAILNPDTGAIVELGTVE